jgi:disulfide bond formation protein DsbB
MTTDTLSLFFALLALACGAAVLVAAVLALVARPALARVATAVQPVALWLAWAVALVATLGSLYYSEVAHFIPCTLCWYQRIAMYPLAIVLGIAALRQDGGIWRYAVPVAVVGLAISIYHAFIEWFPNLDAGFCSADVPCSAAYVTEFGFVGIPFMAACGFAIIIVLLLVARYHRATPSPETPV